MFMPDASPKRRLTFNVTLRLCIVQADLEEPAVSLFSQLTPPNGAAIPNRIAQAARLLPILFAAAAIILSTPVRANDITGSWLREDGNVKINIAPCGEALCGFVTWKRKPDAPGAIGQQILFDMKQNGASEWRGSAFNPEDGKKYSGKIGFAGGALTTTGCAIGGLICKSYNWARAN